MHDELPRKPWKNESFVMNLHSKEKPGSHWVSVLKRGDKVLYFDSYGQIPPSNALAKYLKGCQIKYNFDRFQKLDNSFNCGHLCISFLKKYSEWKPKQ